MPWAFSRRVERMQNMIVVDIWGGYHSAEHLARFIRPLDIALKIAEDELKGGYLVNLRADLAWGEYTDWDDRTKHLVAN